MDFGAQIEAHCNESMIPYIVILSFVNLFVNEIEDV